MNFFKKTINPQDVTALGGTETLYSSRKQKIVIEGIELPKEWSSFNADELRAEARNAILELSRSSNSDFKAKQLGFDNAKHLMDLCFDFILK